MRRHLALSAASATFLAFISLMLLRCGGNETSEQAAQAASCTLVDSGFGPDGSDPVQLESLVSGLEVPWGIAFLPSGDALVTERPGRVRLLRRQTDASGFDLLPDTVATIPTGEGSEGGLLGIATHPQFAGNRLFYVYVTVNSSGGTVNQVQRYRLDDSETSATFDRIVLDGIPAGTFHNGGRIRFGAEGKLYVGTGDSRNPQLAQDQNSPAGKLLRINDDGSRPSDNPFPDSLAYLTGIRNTQGFDWIGDTNLLVTDHGPTGELGRSGHDELSFAVKGDNLGWPNQWRCDEAPDRRAPLMVWADALPPGGAAIYRGDRVSGWNGNLLIGSLGSEHLQRVVLENDSGTLRVARHEVYFRSQFGRLREVIMGPDGNLYITTSNCDGRGSCGAEKDRVLRLVPRPVPR